MRPALKASRPASTASRMAVAMATGSLAPAMAVFIEHAVAAQLHGDGGVRRGAHARVHDHRHRHRLEDELEVVRIADAQPGADGRPSGITAAAPGVLELLAGDRIVVRIGQDAEALPGQRAAWPRAARACRGTACASRR